MLSTLMKVRTSESGEFLAEEQAFPQFLRSVLGPGAHDPLN